MPEHDIRPIDPWQPIWNGSSIPQTIVDKLLPGGRIVLPPGESTSIPRDTYRRCMYKCSGWMKNSDVVLPPSRLLVSPRDAEPEADEDEIRPLKRGKRRTT